MDLLFYSTAPWQTYFSKSTQYQTAKLIHLKTDSEHYKPRKTSEYHVVWHEVRSPAIQFPTEGIFYRLPSLVNKADYVDLSGLSHLLDKQPEREESQPE